MTVEPEKPFELNEEETQRVFLKLKETAKLNELNPEDPFVLWFGFDAFYAGVDFIKKQNKKGVE